METLYEIQIDGISIINTYYIDQYLTARKSALMALTIANIEYVIATNKHELNGRGYFVEKVYTKL